MDEVWCVRPFVKVWPWAISLVRVGGILGWCLLLFRPPCRFGLWLLVRMLGVGGRYLGPSVMRIGCCRFRVGIGL